MRRRTLLIIAIAVVVVIASLTIGLVQLRAQGAADLPVLTAEQLLTNVAQHAPSVAAVSGKVAWANDLTGLELLSLVGQASPGLSSLLQGGSGQVWAEKDLGARLEVQGRGGNTVLVASDTSAWVYLPETNTATEYTFPAMSEPHKALPDPSAMIAGMVERLAPTAALAVSGQEDVAGQTCYILTLTPTAANTVFGSVKVDVDGTTFLPLRAQVFAKGVDQAVLSMGFTDISYDAVPDGTFTFQPPAGATVQHETVTLPSEAVEGGAEKAHAAAPEPLSLADASVEAGFAVPSYQGTDSALSFQGAYVMPAFKAPAIDPAALLGGGLFGQGASMQIPSVDSTFGTAEVMDIGPIVALRYGQGFGTVVLAQIKVGAEQSSQLSLILDVVPVLDSTTVDGASVYQFATQLGSVAVWQKGDLVMVAAGSVGPADLITFVSAVR